MVNPISYLVTMLCVLFVLSGIAAVFGASADPTKPNILFILTDDQDVFLNGTVSLKSNW